MDCIIEKIIPIIPDEMVGTLYEYVNEDEFCASDIKCMTSEMYSNIILNITSTRLLKNKTTYSTINIDNPKNVLEFEIDNYESLGWTISGRDKSIEFMLPSYNDMYIMSTDENPFMYIPICLRYFNVNISGHQVCLIFDKEQNQVYLLDPNGYTIYFDWVNKNTQPDILNNVIENYFTEYIAKFNTLYCTNYSYVKQSTWNHLNKKLNGMFDSDNFEISDGNCVIITLMVIYILNSFKGVKGLKDVYLDLSMLDKESLFYLIKVNYKQVSHILFSLI